MEAEKGTFPHPQNAEPPATGVYNVMAAADCKVSLSCLYSS